jgi:hypothetical protein
MEIGNLLQSLESLAVLGTLLFLGLQIRENTRVTKATASFEATHSWAQLNENIALQPDEIVEPFVDSFQVDYDPSKLTPIQHYRYTLQMRALFQKLEGQFYLFKYGLLEEGLWRQRRSVCKGIIELPHMAAFWAREKESRSLSQEFFDTIDQAESMDATVINRRV